MLNTKNQSGYEPLNLENGSFVNSDNFDATDWNCWETVQNPTVREYTSRGNSVENIHIHEVIGPWDRVIFVGETEAIIREVPLVQSPKGSNSSHFHIPLIFLSRSTFPAMQYHRFSLFLIPFLILEKKKRSA